MGMTWLKKVGLTVASGLAAAAPYLRLAGGMAMAIDPAAAPIISLFELLLGNVVMVEGANAAVPALASTVTGQQKAQQAAALNSQHILAWMKANGKKVANQQLFQQAMTNIAGGVADLANSWEDD